MLLFKGDTLIQYNSFMRILFMVLISILLGLSTLLALVRRAEPVDIAITEAIEKAVHSLVIEGILEKMWALDNPMDISSEQIQDYISEKEQNLNEDIMGIPFEQDLRGRFYTTLIGSGQFYLGDYSSEELRPGLALNLGLGLSRSFFLEANFGAQSVQINNFPESFEYNGDLRVKFLANHRGRFSPLISAGGGAYYNFGSNVGLSEKKAIPYFTFGLGLEYLFTERFALMGKGFINQMWSDFYDGTKAGFYNDNIWGFELGFKFYLGQPR